MNKNELTKLIIDYLDKYPDDEHALKTIDFLGNNELFWQRKNLLGHITASAWVINQDKNKALLTHHIELDKWFQLGGHIEYADKNIYDAAKRELEEESGLQDFRLESSKIFDIDVHQIPISKKGVPAHYHYDIRLLFVADENKKIKCQATESNAVQWLHFNEIKSKTNEYSVLRMIEKVSVL